jgi:Ca2+-binding RTX toxin-like protein
VNLVALATGGFAMSYTESRGFEASAVRVEFYTPYGVRTVRADTLVSLGATDPRSAHDLIALSGGGVALALVTLSRDGLSTDVEVLLFDEDGALTSRARAAPGENPGNQGAPALIELADGRLGLLYTDASAEPVDGDVEPLVLTFFDLTEPAAVLDGTTGRDRLGGTGGADLIRGLAGDDRIAGRNGGDTLEGGSGDDVLDGGLGNDGLRGGEGADALDGGDGDDGLAGGDGDDILAGGAGRDILDGDADDDRIAGGDGGDRISGATGNDRMQGQAGSDTLKGGAGADRIAGGGSADRLQGGDGDDTLGGGGGADAFVFRSDERGDDTISDFDAALDRIELAGFRPAAIEVSTAAGNTVIDTGAGTITLVGVRLDAGEILFDFG